MGLALVQSAPAKFDRSASHRRAMLAKIHLAKKSLQLDEDDFRQILMQEAGRGSAGDCTEAELERVLGRFQALGWKPLPKAGGSTRPAQHPVARKARALWISLYHLGAVRSPKEAALEAFAKRQLKCERLVWANQSDGYKLIEALKAMADKHCWSQVDAKGNGVSVIVLQSRLCDAILAKLVEKGVARADWNLNVAAWRLCGIELGADGPVTPEGYQSLAKALGEKLRAAGGAA